MDCKGCARNIPKWWRRGELNPRPQWSHYSIYARVLSFNLANATAGRQAIASASVHEMFRQ